MLAIVIGVSFPVVSWLTHDTPGRALAAPLNAKVEETAATMLRVSWLPVARTSYYEVTLTSKDQKPASHTVRSSTPQAQVPALQAGADYTVRVRAVVGPNGPRRVTPYSHPIKVRTEDRTRPALLAPQSFATSSPKPGTLQASWEKIESATGYELQYSRHDDFRDATTVTSPKPSATVDKFDGNIRFHVRVRSAGPGDARSAWSAATEITTATPEGPAPVRVASYNVRCHGCGSPSWASRRGPVATLISSQNPDVVGLQEAQQSRPRGFGISQFADLVNAVSALGPDYRVTQPDIGASKGTRIIFKPSTLTLLDQGAIRYARQRGGATSRYAAWAIFRQRATGKEFAFFSTHLEPKNYGVRLAQARELAGSMSRIAGDRPVMAVGDFNASQFHYYAIHQTMTAAGLVDVIGVQASSRRPSPNAPAEKRIRSNFDSYQGSHRSAHATASNPQDNGVYLDYIFTSPMRVMEFENVMRLDNAGRFVGTLGSDHSMLRADVVLPD